MHHKKKGYKVISVSLSSVLERHNFDGPICHVGSKDWKGTSESSQSFRHQFDRLPNHEFIGLDVEDGLNVDVTADITDEDLFRKHSDLRGHFGLVFCSALLEHVPNPFTAAGNISALIRKDGHLYFQGPWVWGYHGYPDDYWRISFSGLKVLFPQFQWLEWWYAGTNQKKGILIDDVRNERGLFAGEGAKGPGEEISDRSISYLLVCGVARKVKEG